MSRHRTATIVAGLALLAAFTSGGEPPARAAQAEAPTPAAQAEAPARATAPPPPAVKLPVPLLLGTQLIPAGTYAVRLESGPRGMDLVLLKDGSEVARELSLRPYRQPKKAAKAAWTRKDTREEKALRVYYQDGLDVRFAVFALAD
jgi:hypothetical protein